MPDVWAQEPCPTVPVAWNIPKMNTKNIGTLCENAEKNAVASPLEVIFSPRDGTPRKNHNNFSFWFLLPHSVHITILFSQ